MCREPGASQTGEADAGGRKGVYSGADRLRRRGAPSTSLQAEVFKGGRGKQREDIREVGGQSSTGRPALSMLTGIWKLVK